MGEKECFMILIAYAGLHLMNLFVFSLSWSTIVYLIYTVLINVLTQILTDCVSAWFAICYDLISKYLCESQNKWMRVPELWFSELMRV